MFGFVWTALGMGPSYDLPEFAAKDDPGYLAVRQFIKARQDGDSAGAMDCLTTGAAVGTPWGYHAGKQQYEKFLTDETKFDHRLYLYTNDQLIKKIDDKTYQRMYRYNRGMMECPRSRSPMYREVYYLNDDNKLKLVSCFKQTDLDL